MRKLYYFPLVLLNLLVLASSCKNEIEDEIEQTDYSIQSTESFELISQHSNGWIKEGRYHYNDIPTKEFEYYENGNLRSAKIYNDYPSHHLYMEVARCEDNKALWSKYYKENGDLYMETDYENGLVSVKKVYAKEGTAIHSYDQGMISKIEFTSDDGRSKTSTSYEGNNSKEVKVIKDGNIILEKIFPYHYQLGDGIYGSTEVTVSNPFGEIEIGNNTVNQSYFSSVQWKSFLDPFGFMTPFRLIDKFYANQNQFITEFAIGTEQYQSVIEQYPFNENGVLIGGFKFIDMYSSLTIPFAQRDSLANLYEEDSAAYVQKFGDQYVDKMGYGQSYFVIGAIRNLPTNSVAADEIKNIAYRYMNNIVSRKEPVLNTREQELFNSVWFEIRFFSYLEEHQNGLLIDSPEKFANAVKNVEQSGLRLMQVEYKTVEYL